jgi:LacI family repressor for deo operon, udp, cdd, tsx, nupC, and nupG
MNSPRPQMTLADIARLAGVGSATASRALNNDKGVSTQTRQRVLDIAAQYAYVVSPEAVRLAKGSLGRVAVVAPHFSRWFFGEIVEGIEAVLRAAGIDVLLYFVGSLEDRRSFFDKLPARRKVDAVIVVGFPVEKVERARLELLNVHIVAAGGQRAVYPNVCIDDYRAGRQAMDHLLFLGHQRIGMIEAVDLDQPTEPSGRSSAYRDALRESKLAIDPELVVSAPWGGEQGAEAMDALLSLKTPPTAVYAHSDEVAMGAMRSIRRAGLRIPEDISIIGIDDHPIAALVDLTTIRQPVRSQGELAAQMVLTLLEGKTLPEREVTVSTQLTMRSSTAPPRQNGRQFSS